MAQLLAAATDPAPLPLPHLTSLVPAGFPSPAMDFEEGELDIGAYLVRHPAASYWMRVSGRSMEGAGIYDRDLILVDRSLLPMDEDIVVATVAGEITVKRFRIRGTRVWLEPDPVGGAYPIIEMTDGQELDIFGVVASSVRDYRGR